MSGIANATTEAEKRKEVKCTDDVLERLAMRLHSEMEHLDPTIDGVEWEALTDHKREFYRLCVEAIRDELN